MLRLSIFSKSKELWSIRYGYMGCDYRDEWYFVGPDDEWSVWVPDDSWLILVPDIDWRRLGSTPDIP